MICGQSANPSHDDYFWNDRGAFAWTLCSLGIPDQRTTLMKRTVNNLLIMLLIVSVTGAASAVSKHPKKKHPKPQPEIALEALPAVSGKAKPAQGITPTKKSVAGVEGDGDDIVSPPQNGHGIPFGKPVEQKLIRAGSRRFDLRSLPFTPITKFERPEHEEPIITRSEAGGAATPPQVNSPAVPASNAPAPPPNASFDGLDFATWGAGHPPDTVGDVGPTYYIQSINSSIGVFRKSDGVRVAAFTLNTFMQQGNFGNLCDTNNFGDPVILYDTFEDRWIITDFAFTLSGGNVVNPPGAFQCIAASMNGDPVSGGWNFYSINTQFGLGDYPKFGIWPDGLYMTASIFGYPSGAPFQNARAYAFNKQQMYAGTPSVQVVSFNILGGDFTILPSNARLQTGTPPPGSPNYYLSTWLFLNAVTVYKFHVDWNNISLSTFTGPDVPIAATSWPNANVPNAPSLGGNALDVLQIRAMMQNQYTNIGGAESLWATHTVRRANTSGFAAPRWYQVDVTGGNVNPNIPQATTWDPDGANVFFRFVPSLGVDRAGDMALGYSVSSSTTKPAIMYAGRLASDPVNTFSQTEQLLLQGTGTQSGNCGGAPCTRWGDYSAMSLDPNGCTFWYTNMYYAVDGLNHQTRIGSFGPFAGCTPVAAGGTLSGTVSATSGGAPLPGAVVQFGSRSATTDGSGLYSLSIPAGTYPSVSASKPGFIPASAAPVIITDGNTTTQNFSLNNAPTSACIVDTTQSDFQHGTPSGIDLTTQPGSAALSGGDPQNTIISTSGGGITATTWGGQTFTPLGTGQVTKIDINLFCSACSGTPQDLTVGIRATSGGFPTGPDLATAIIPGFLAGTQQYYTATFASPPTLNAGTLYAFVIHPAVNPTGTYALSRSGADVYPGGTRVSGASSGTVWSNPLTATQTTDAGFHVWMAQFLTAGNFVSSVKDADPNGGITSIWGSFSWNATTPANTAVQFQIAGSNSPNGPFNFVGPDGTAGTFFTTSPVQLSPQFYNFRYLEYKAFLSTTDANVRPSLDDVTICFNDVDCSGVVATITTPPAVCPLSTGNTASAPPGMTNYAWGITNGTITSATNTQTIAYTAGGAGTLTLGLTITAPNGCIVSSTQPVSINTPPAKPTISGTLTFCPGGNTTLSSDAISGNQWYLGGNPINGATGQQYVASIAGSYTVQVTDGNGCVGQMSDPAVVTQLTPPPTPTISATTNGTGTQDQACPEQQLTLTANGATGATSYQWYNGNTLLNGQTSQTYQASAAGTYYVTATANGCTTPQSAGYVVQDPTPATPTISANGSTAICTGGTVTLHSDLTGGIQWWKDESPIEDPNANNQDYPVTVAGTYKVQLNALGCHSQFSNSIVVTQSSMPTTPTITAQTNGTNTQDQACPAQPLTLTATSTGAESYQWYNDNAPIGDGTNTLIVTGAGNYSVTAINGGCTTPSSATYVVINPTPHTPFLSVRGSSTTICNGGSVLLDSDRSGLWYKDGVAQNIDISYLATSPGTYTLIATANGCSSPVSNSIVLTAGAGQAPDATITAPATVLTNSSNNVASVPDAGPGATYVWSIVGGNITSGAGTRSVVFTCVSNIQHPLTVDITTPSGCTTTNSIIVTSLAQMTTTHFSVSAPATATSGTQFSVVVTALDNTNSPVTNYSGTVHFTSSSAGTLPADTAFAGAADNGSHSFNVTLTSAGPQTITVSDGSINGTANVTVQCPIIDATITAPASVITGSTGNIATVANAGAGAAYAWSITNGTITGGAGTNSITFTAGAIGPLTLNATVTKGGCSDSKAATVAVTAPAVTVTSITPNNGPYFGGTPVTINGTGFQTGATVIIGGTFATNVVRVSATQVTAKTVAHAGGTVNVTVTNPDTGSGTLLNGYTYRPRQFDANGDNVVDPSDIFYLINYLFMHGNAPMGSAGMLSGDANGDGVVDPADIFFIVNYLFSNGPQPFEVAPGAASTLAVRNDDSNRVAGSITLGRAVRRGDHLAVPVIVTRDPNSAMPHAIALNLKFEGASDATIHRAGATKDVSPTFEATRHTDDDGLAYVVTYDASFEFKGSAVVAELELARGARIDIDPKLTMLSDQGGMHNATVANGTLKVGGTVVKQPSSNTPEREH